MTAVFDTRDGSPFRTFDLFDTLITRRHFRPEDLFLSLEQALSAQGIPTGDQPFSSLRHKMDSLVRERLQVEEISIDDIYDGLQQQLSWTAQQRSKALALELSCEYDAIVTVGELSSTLKGLSKDAFAIISDSYLHTEFILKLIDKCGLICDGRQVFVSSHYKTTKSRKKLYGIVADSLGLPPQQILHQGDNKRSDVQQAKRAGFKVQHFPHSAATHAETQFYREIAGTQLQRSLVAGAIKAGRLAFPGGSEHERTLWRVGSNVAAPLLYAYVAWTIAEARHRGIRHLYFLSRDGQVLLEIARTILAADKQPEPTCGYLFASRQSWHLPAITSFDAHVLSWLSDAAGSSSIRSLLSRVELRPEACRSALESIGISEEDWDRPHTEASHLSTLLSDPDIQALILENAAKARKRILRYLRNQGFGGKEPVGIVDLGWHGRLQRSLHDILESDTGTSGGSVTGFYLALKSVPAGLPPDRLVTFSRDNSWLGPAPIQLCETFCTADHRGVRGFQDEPDGSVSPVFSETSEQAIRVWGFEALRAGIIETVRLLSQAQQTLDLDCAEVVAALSAAAQQAFIEFVERPDAAEASAFGSFPFELDQAHEKIEELAPRVSTLQLWSMILFGGRRSRLPNPWKEAIVARSAVGLSLRLARTVFALRECLLVRATRKVSR